MARSGASSAWDRTADDDRPVPVDSSSGGRPRSVTSLSNEADDIVQFSFRAPRELRKRANRASIELEVPVQELAAAALDQFLAERGF